MPPPILIPGVCHEGFPLGRDSPLARDRRTQKAGDCPASALLHQDRQQGIGNAVAALADGQRRRRRGGILDPYHPQIDGLIAKYPELSAVRVLEEISRGPEGYRGSVYAGAAISSPRSGRFGDGCIRRCFTSRAKRCKWIGATAGLLTIGQTTRRVSVFVAVLCYSRLCYIEFSLSQRKAEFYRALVNALNFFGGSPQKDNF